MSLGDSRGDPEVHPERDWEKREEREKREELGELAGGTGGTGGTGRVGGRLAEKAGEWRGEWWELEWWSFWEL